MNNYLFVMLGGALGALMRYMVSRMCSGVTFLSIPIGTFAVNIAGCFILGVLTGVSSRYVSCLPQGLTLMLTVGMCGAFTTFSTFSSETIRLMNDGNLLQALLYVSSSIVIGFFLFWVGSKIV